MSGFDDDLVSAVLVDVEGVVAAAGVGVGLSPRAAGVAVGPPRCVDMVLLAGVPGCDSKLLADVARATGCGGPRSDARVSGDDAATPCGRGGGDDATASGSGSSWSLLSSTNSRLLQHSVVGQRRRAATTMRHAVRAWSSKERASSPPLLAVATG